MVPSHGTPSTPRRVLWISCVGEKGGAEVYLLNFLRNLDRQRYRAGVVLLRPGPFAEDLRAAGIETFILRRHRMRNVLAVGRSILEIRRIVRRHGFHVLHGNGFRGHAYGGIAARLAGVPAVWSVHTVERPTPSTRMILRIPVASVTANCPRTADWFAARGLPVNLIWPPVELASLSRRTPRADLHERLGLPADAPWIAMASRLQRYKGHEFLLRAFAALSSRFSGHHLVIVGAALFGMEEDYLDHLRKLASGLGIAGRVHFPGFVSDEDLYGILAESTCVVHPALDEDFGLVIAEAQALERPVLAFAAVGPAAIIEQGRTGVLVPVGDQEALNVELAAMLARSPEERAAMGTAGRIRVERHFAAPAAARRLERVYDSCLGGPPLRLDALRQPE